ncbi:uncharacterized protein F4812DRAFT_438297 [Daldinia caldariorum]|uniref:uncharacterized protein n=1 Tax=Daldinia caldariorum TaxID=326644 RepID=UPI00200820FF|nr:uncharacterized protein F4812DRAFT_438297 [Daldinia caldariorum]KAI1465327.1 hypothetical protein F4812DRAFT_438297 [Daldinia caldariorum]
MRFLPLSLVASFAAGALASSSPELKIEVTLPVECDRKTESGDNIQVHYRGTLASNGKKFDASYDRGTPFSFMLGGHQVIQGWEEGLLGMCIGEKRTLTVPPEYGYGNRGVGPIPAGSTIVFETELIGIKGVPKPESIVTKATSSASSTASEAVSEASSEVSETAEKATAKVAEKIASKVEEAAEVVGTLLVDTDDVQEHNEL